MIPALTRLWIASDHAGFELKSQLMKARPDLPWHDLGPTSDARVDYPDFAKKLTESLIGDMKSGSHPVSATGFSSLGVLICGSGQGMCMSANRVRGIRAALCWTSDVARLAREHNNANVLCLPGRLVPEATALAILTTFLATSFGGGRHQGRIEKF